MRQGYQLFTGRRWSDAINKATAWAHGELARLLVALRQRHAALREA